MVKVIDIFGNDTSKICGVRGRLRWRRRAAPIVSYEREFPELEDRDATERPTKYLRKVDGRDEFEVVEVGGPSRMLLVNNLRDGGRRVARSRLPGCIGDDV